MYNEYSHVPLPLSPIYRVREKIMLTHMHTHTYTFVYSDDLSSLK